MRRRVVLDSAAISVITYDEERQTLDVQYREAAAYRYFTVPKGEFEALLRAESAGAFWNRVKEKYPYEKLD